MKRALVASQFVRLVLAVALVAVFHAEAVAAVSVVQVAHAHAQDPWGQATVSCTLPTPTGSSHSLIVGAVAYGARGPVHVTSIVDDKGNTYSSAPVGSAIDDNAADVEVWHALGATAGVTQVTVTFGLALSAYKECYVYEVAGALALDNSASVNNGVCFAHICSGAPVVTSTTAGFVVGIILGPAVGPLLRAAEGNEFSGLIGYQGMSAVAVLISSTAASHQPAWREFHGSRSWLDRSSPLWTNACNGLDDRFGSQPELCESGPEHVQLFFASVTVAYK